MSSETGDLAHSTMGIHFNMNAEISCCGQLGKQQLGMLNLCRAD